MNLNNFTIKSQETLQKAQQLAFNNQNQAIESGHLLKALLDDDDNAIEYLLKKNDVNVGFISGKLDEQLNRYPKVSGGTEPGQTLSREGNNALLRAGAAIQEFKDEFVSVEHLLLGILGGNDDTAKLLKDAGLTEKGLKAAIRELRKGNTVNSQTADTQYNSLQKYAKNLNELARAGKLDPVIGRAEEIRRTLHILSRRSKNNPILLGEPGVGKTAIVEGLAQRIVEGRVPIFLASKRIVALDLSLIVAATKYRCQFEERLKGILKELTETPDVIVFIDEILSLVGAGSAEGSLDAA